MVSPSKVQLNFKTPPIQDAFQVSMNTIQELSEWMGSFQVDVQMKFDGTPNVVLLKKVDATITAREGDWIIKDADSFRAIKKADFETQYKLILPSGTDTAEPGDI